MKFYVEKASHLPMHPRISLICAVASLGLAVPFGASVAQPAPAAPAAPRNPPSVYAEYHPTLSDQMTIGIQPRHTKLGLAIQAGNWAYANYEVGELRGAFRRIAQAMPTYEGKDTTMALSMIMPPLDAGAAAIKAQDAKAATAGYADLTGTCNTCHQSLGRNYIVIRDPAAASYPDQDFSPH